MPCCYGRLAGDLCSNGFVLVQAKYDGQEGNLAAEGILQGSLDHANLLPLVALLKSACGQQTALVLPWAEEGTLGNILKCASLPVPSPGERSLQQPFGQLLHSPYTI